MGIPRFYRFISTCFPSVSSSVSFNTTKQLDTEINNLYLDANGIIYNCVHELFFKRKPRYYNDKKHQTQIIYKTVSEYMDQLLKFVRPTSLFYIAFDGTAPLAKQSQQRQRRFRSVLEKSQADYDIFDTTCITPGTDFMVGIANYMNFFIRLKMTVDPVWAGISVIFSSANVQGEAEHKIINYIKNLPIQNKEETHCIYGLDADLFMLSLSCHSNKMYLLREDQFSSVWHDTFFYFVDIGKLYGEMVEKWKGTRDVKPKNLINDFIVICFFAGNDFLHSLPQCYDLQKSIPEMMGIYKSVSYYLTTETGAIEYQNIACFLEEMSDTEIQAIASQEGIQNDTRDDSLEIYIDEDGNTRSKLNYEIYRKLYYEKAGVKSDCRISVGNFCKKYLEGLDWTNFYYHNTCRNWLWFYPYHYSPLTSDLLQYLDKHNYKDLVVSNWNQRAFCAFQQLICVIPPKSINLIPSVFHNLYREMILPYYPENCEIDKEGKLMDWEGVVKLPFIEPQTILDVYYKSLEPPPAKGETYKPNIHKNVNNLLHRPLLFRFDPATPSSTYRSQFGILNNVRVRYQILDH